MIEKIDIKEIKKHVMLKRQKQIYKINMFLQ
jgi:hypothetical protein